MRAIFPIREWRCQDIDQVLLHEILFFLFQCIQQQWSVRQLLPFGVNCRLQLAGLGKKREETVKPTSSSLLYVPVKLKLQHPPWAYPGHLTPFLAREGGNLIVSLDVMPWDKSWLRRRRCQTLMMYFWRVGWKPKAYTSCVPYLNLYLWYTNMCCLINHIYMHNFRNIIEATD